MITARQWAVSAARHVATPVVEGSEDLPLAAFQAHAASRLAAMIRTWGGALLADGVGLGKTRVAMTVAATIAREQRIAGATGVVWLCVPSRLADGWREAAQAVGVEHVAVVTHAALSRGRTPAELPLVIVVDEAHRFRNPNTARRATLAAHANVPLLLATATPVANSTSDLWNLLELFLDDADVRATFGWDLATARRLAETGEWDPIELVREVTVRRTEPPATTGFGRRPGVSLQVVGYDPSPQEAWMWANLESHTRTLSLVRDGDWPAGLFVEHVLRRWESGADALLETIRELHAYAERRLEAAREGRTLDRHSFRALFGEQPEQEVFSFLYPTSERPPPDIASLETDVGLLGELVERAQAVCEDGLGRAEAVVELAKSVDRLLVFTSYRTAARGLFARLVAGLGPQARIGLVTGGQARATGLGRVSPAELLRRFAPRAHGATYREHQQLDVLVATDCIAEGANLQDCGHIVLADLPYSPLGVEQRIGRLLRPGGEHDEVSVYLCRPTNWNDSLGMRRRLSTKLQAARGIGFGDVETGPFAALTTLDRLALGDAPTIDLPRAAKIVADPTTWLVLARVDGRPWFFVVGPDRSASFVVQLSELAHRDDEVMPCEVPPIVSDTLHARERFLRGALQAPTTLMLDAPEASAWRALIADAVALGLGRDALDAIRSRLLRRQRLGTRRMLQHLVDTGSTSRLARFAAELPAPREAVKVELVCTLGV